MLFIKESTSVVFFPQDHRKMLDLVPIFESHGLFPCCFDGPSIRALDGKYVTGGSVR